MIKLLLVLLFILLIKDAVSQDVACYGGSRTFTNHVITHDGIRGEACWAQSICGFATFIYTLNSDQVKKEYAFCSYNNVTDSCEGIAQIRNVPSPRTCSFSNCTGFACNTFPTVAGCPQPGSLNQDIQILPSCTLKSAWTSVLECVNPVMSGYPYSSVTTCSSKFDEAFQCGAEFVPKCLSGHCPTILDIIPADIRSFYPVVLQYVKNFTSLDSIFHALRLPSEDSVAAMKGVFCLQRNNTMLNSLIEQLNGTENVNLTFKNPVCDNTVVQDLVRMAVPAARKVFAARTRDELCSPITNLLSEAKKAWKTRCSKAEVVNLIRSVLPGAYSALLTDMELGIDIVENLFLTFEIPNCGGGNSAQPVTASPFFFWTLATFPLLSTTVMLNL